MHKNRAVSLFKGITIIGVVAHHLANRRFQEPIRAEIGWLGGIMDWVVPAFILVSGYLHGLSHERKPIGFGVFVMSRGRRLILPFVVIGVIYGIIYFVLIHTRLLSDPNGPKDMAWWQICWSCLTFQPGGVGEQLYFFPLLFVLSCVATVLLAAYKYQTKVIFAGSAGVFALAVILALTGSDYSFIWPLDRLAYGVGIYLLGFGLSTQKSWMKYWAVGTAGAIMLLFFLGKPSLVSDIVPVLLLSGLLAVNAGWKPLEQVGEASGTIFLYHTPFILQTLLIVIAEKAPKNLQVFGAYAIGLCVVIILTIMHSFLIRSKLKWIAL